MVLMISHLTSFIVKTVVPWLQQYLFGTAVKQASKSALNKSHLHFEKPNLLLAGISVLFFYGLNFLVLLLHTDSKTVPVVTTVCVTAVTAFFLFRGFLSPRAKREREVLLLMMLFFLLLFMVCYLVYDVKWLAFASKIVLEVVLCWSVMLSELHRLNKAQSLVVGKVMQALRINPDRRIGKLLLNFGKAADDSLSAITKGSLETPR